MFWEERLEYIKNKLGPAEFTDPFTAGVGILKKIDDRFFIRDPNYFLTHWTDRIRHKVAVGSTAKGNLWSMLKLLPDTSNYWWVPVYEAYPDCKPHVYNCSVRAIKWLLTYHIEGFFIVDKHYNWCLYCCRRKEEQTMEVFKAGNGITPLDGKL
ncbi:hypothetical protein [Chitinophaga agri]|uniref:Uncharacterized protein n=1 Tax=Chitinophaga agri TaxID=2703787 RepID=A0A6B9ZGF3_9BACT|nr:hypothetical protein [Chitinophaga agri]QHS60541.1 hypothetical protein GWR21_13355 [Chitinophaga agri]